MVHVVSHSKTGVHAPSLPCIRSIQAAYPEDVVVMIDAAQGRISRRGLRTAMEEGWMVLFTGSKFYGGPPFSGALFVPSNFPSEGMGIGHLPVEFCGYFTAGELPTEWGRGRASLPEDPNLGLILRWQAALAEIEAYYAAPPEVRYTILRAFERMVPRLLAGSSHIHLEETEPPVNDDGSTPLLESKKTVFSFYLSPSEGAPPLKIDALRDIFTWMNRDLSTCLDEYGDEMYEILSARFHIGQPVVTSASNRLAMLRVALGGPLIVKLAEDGELGSDLNDRLEWLTDRLRIMKRKLEFLARNYSTLSQRVTLDNLGADR